MIVHDTDINNLAAALAEELLREGIETVAVMDLTDPEGNISQFEQQITENLFLALTGFTGKLWVVSGTYLRNLLSGQEPPDKVWHVMGIKAVVSGTAAVKSENITIRLTVSNTETAETISTMIKVCRTAPGLNVPDTPLAMQTRELVYDIPSFPWPPPEASASAKVPSKFLRSSAADTTLADAARTIEEALDHTGYTERSYYAVPEGFALVTRLEQFNPDGTSKNPPDRWAVEVTRPKVFSLKSYLEALFKAQEGHFRIISFIVTTMPFMQSTQAVVSREEAMEWLTSGVQILPHPIGERPYTEHHYCVALIYEFEQPTRNHEPFFKKLSLLPGVEHLKQAQLWKHLEK